MRPRTITLRTLSLALLAAAQSVAVFAQSPPAAPAPTADSAATLPAGVSDMDVEIFCKLAYTWSTADRQVIEAVGDFELRMGGYRLHGNDAVVWFHRPAWRDRPYYEMEVFLWRSAEVRHPAGTVESGDALLAGLRSFGKLVLNADGHAARDDSDSELYRTAMIVRSGVDAPAAPVDEAAEPVQHQSPVELLKAAAPREPPPPVSYSSDQLRSMLRDGRRLVVATGNVYAARGSQTSGEYLELRADSAVLFMAEEEKLQGAVGGAAGSRPSDGQPGANPDEPPAAPADERLRDEPRDERAVAGEYVEAVYLEGDVVLTRGSRMIRASRIFYDFQTERALILDAVMRAFAAERAVPIYVRAEQVRQLSAVEYRADRATLSSSEFHTPHLALGAEQAMLVDRTPRNERGEVIGVTAGTYDVRDATLQLEGVPLIYSPRSKGDFSEEDSSFRGVRVGYSDEFGGIFESRWALFNVLGLERPEGFDATLLLDWLTQRGPGIGLNSDYQREDYYGLFRGYYINDQDEDDLGGNPQRGGPPDTDNRGRALWRHRRYFEKGWELTLETSYISDDQYLEEYERNEFENGKEQETLAYLLKRQRNWQFSTLANFNINDFLTETEHFGDTRFSLIGEPLGEYLTLYSDSRAGVVRYDRSDKDREFLLPPNQRSSRSIYRGDTREELTLNLPALGPLKVTPFGSIRGSAWDGSPDEGGLGRVLGVYGLRGNAYAQRVFDDVESRLLDLHRLRHVLKPEFTVFNSHDNTASSELYPFDPDVEGVDDFGGAVMGLRQRFQTQRGEPGRWRTVDWIVLDIESAFFNRPRPLDNTHGNFVAHRPEDSISSNYLSIDFQYRLSDSTALIYDGVFDWNEGNAGVSNVSLAVERLPRFSGMVGWRYIHDTDNNLLALAGNYKLNEKHTIGVREYYDIDRNRNAETQLVFVRRWPRWYTAVSVEWDQTVQDFSLNLSAWPEGAPNLAVGSRRFTGLGQSVGVRP